MTGSDRHNDERNNQQDPDSLLEQFPEEERELIRTLWENSRRARPDVEAIPENEIEQSLDAVHKRLDFDDDQKSGSKLKYLESPENFNWRWIAAAASVLLIFGAGILFVPKKVQVPYAETQTLALPDGSEVTLNSGSELRYSRLFAYFNRELELNGEAFFNVREGEQPFTVEANGATVRVTGTAFNVRSWREDPNSQTEVTVSEGTVEFYPGSLEDRSVSVTAGQLSSWRVGLQKPTEPDSVSLDHVLSWRDQTFAFYKKPLDLVLRELERRFDIQVELEATALSSELVTVYYVNPQNVESILQDICRIKGLRYAKGARGYRVYE